MSATRKKKRKNEYVQGRRRRANTGGLLSLTLLEEKHKKKGRRGSKKGDSSSSDHQEHSRARDNVEKELEQSCFVVLCVCVCALCSSRLAFCPPERSLHGFGVLAKFGPNVQAVIVQRIGPTGCCCQLTGYARSK